MSEHPSLQAPENEPSQKLILVFEPDEELGNRLVQIIRRTTSFKAILATTLHQARSIQEHLICDLILLSHDTFPPEKQDSLLAGVVKPKAVLHLRLHSSTNQDFNANALKSILKAMTLLFSVLDAP